MEAAPVQNAKHDLVNLKPAVLNIKHFRRVDPNDPNSERILVGEETTKNLVLNAGRVQLHTAGYGSSGLPTNGFNYVAVSNDATAPAATDTTLASEISANGFARVQASTITLPTGSGNQTVIAHTFTASGTQSVQKCALFDASSGGTMNHEFQFTQRNLVSSDELDITITVTLG